MTTTDKSLPKTRTEAEALGLRLYFTGRPCKHGHIAPRRTYSKDCVDCARGHSRGWKKKNPALVRAGKRKWYWNNTEKVSKKKAAKYKAAPEKIKRRVKAYRLANPEKVRKAKRRRYAANIEQARERSALEARARRGRLRGAEGHHTKQDIANIRRLQNDRCAYCRRKLKGIIYMSPFPLHSAFSRFRRAL